MAVNHLDGMRAGDYAGSLNWEPTRWAWEFLSRNQEYRSICEELDRQADLQEARQIAKFFGLKKYKSAFDQYDAADSPAPCFLPNTVYAQARLARKDAKAYKRALNVGDMVVRFSLLDVLDNPAAVDAKMRAIEKLAKQNLAQLHVKTKTKPTAVRIGHDKDWLAMLRLLDALQAKVSAVEIARTIFPALCQTKDGLRKTDDQLCDLIKERKKRAHELANKRYLYVAAWAGKSVAPAPSKSAG